MRHKARGLKTTANQSTYQHCCDDSVGILQDVLRRERFVVLGAVEITSSDKARLPRFPHVVCALDVARWVVLEIHPDCPKHNSAH